MKHAIYILLVILAGFNDRVPVVTAKPKKADPLLLRLKDSVPAICPYAGELGGKRLTLMFSYSAIACGCAQWIISKGRSREIKEGEEYFYLERQVAGLIKAESLWDGERLPFIVKVSGRFSKEKELPVTYPSKATLEKARIFWYEKISLVTLGSKD